MLDDYQGTYLIIGPPGTGKTTFLAKQIRAFVEMNGGEDPGILVASLTKAAAQELAGRDLPLPRESVGTLHSLGYRALGRPHLVDDRIDEWNTDNPRYAVSPDTSSAMDDLSEEKSQGDNRIHSEYHLYRARMIPRDAWKDSVLAFAVKWEEWKEKTGLIDFTDMIESPLLMGLLPPGGAQIIFADEAQDLSKLEYTLLRTWAKRAQALFLAGDPWQALYTWRGAYPQLFEDPDIPDSHRRVLSRSYRVSRAVHTAAMCCARSGLYSGKTSPIQYLPREEAGSVGYLSATWRAPKDVIRSVQRDLEEPGSVMVLATCAYMLVPTIKALREAGLWYSNPWRRKRGDWNPLASVRGTPLLSRLQAFMVLADFERQRRQQFFGWTTAEACLWIPLLEAKGTIQHGKKQIFDSAPPEEEALDPWPFETLENILTPEAYDSFRKVCMGYEHSTQTIGEWLIDRSMAKTKPSLRYALSVGMAALSEPPRVFVGTVHSVKGGEADTVYMFPDLSPKAEDPLSSARAAYVGITRARKRFVSLAPSVQRLALPLGAWTSFAREMEESECAGAR